MLSAVPPTTHGIDAMDHDGQVSERTLNRLVDMGANGSMFDGLQTDDGERRNAELEALKDEEHSMTEMEALEAELETLMEETQDMLRDGDNNDTQSNGSGVTNGYAFDFEMNRLARALD